MIKSMKEHVKQQYSKVVEQADGCCSAACCGEGFNQDYSALSGYYAQADYGLGCGLPTESARIRRGQTVLDLGSGAGNDCFVASAEVGAEGKVYGLDFTEQMTLKARHNAAQLGLSNVEFITGDIEDIPLPAASVDVVISNCVLNLVPDKARVFAQIRRVLAVGGHMSIADVVTVGEAPAALRGDAGFFASCIAGAMPKGDYLQTIAGAGLVDIEIQKERQLDLPQSLRAAYLPSDDFQIYSITVFARKAA